MIGRKLKMRRLELGMTQEELAHKLGYKSKSTINKIELNHHDVSQSKLMKLADALDCSPSYLLDDDSSDLSSDNLAKALALYDKYQNAIPQVRAAVDSLLKPVQSDP